MMRIWLQLILYCALFTLMVKIGAGNHALHCLYFYPKPYQEEAYRRKLADRETVERKRRRFMIPFFLVMLAALVGIIGLWNGVRGFWPAYGQALLFLEVMNAYDGAVIDRLWVGHSRFWVISGMEDVNYVQTWEQVLKKRAVLCVIWIGGAAIVAAVVAGIFA
ncbi:MAG: hypothetical protein IJ246_03745 [Clostridia bacterium]|nr:hypothetical protein [Clostridia bacterium]